MLTIERGTQQISALTKLCLHTLFLYNSSSHTLEGSISLHGLDFSLQETDGEICFVRFQASCPVTTSQLRLNLTAVAQKSKDDPNRIKVQGESERATSHLHNALLLSRSNIEVRDILHSEVQRSYLHFRLQVAHGEVRALPERRSAPCNTWMEGAFLEKKSHGFLSSWQKRYFRVEGDLLCYYHEEPVTEITLA
jgi:hypothetical protein